MLPYTKKCIECDGIQRNLEAAPDYIISHCSTRNYTSDWWPSASNEYVLYLIITELIKANDEVPEVKALLVEDPYLCNIMDAVFKPIPRLRNLAKNKYVILAVKRFSKEDKDCKSYQYTLLEAMK